MSTNGKTDKKKPHLERRRWTLPPGLDCKTFVMREIDAKDEQEAARMAESRMDPGKRTDIKLLFDAEQRERQRISLEEVDGNPVNTDAPFFGMDKWTSKTMLCVTDAFSTLNSIPEDELKKFRESSQLVTATDGADPARSTGAPDAG